MIREIDGAIVEWHCEPKVGPDGKPVYPPPFYYTAVWVEDEPDAPGGEGR